MNFQILPISLYVSEFIGENKNGNHFGNLLNHLKVCPLCWALNVRSSYYCSLCSWHGDFVYDEKMVQFALKVLSITPDNNLSKPRLYPIAVVESSH